MFIRRIAKIATHNGIWQGSSPCVGISLEFKKKNGGTPLQFLKVQVSWLLGAAGKAEIK